MTSFNLRKVTSHRLLPNGASFETEDADFLVSESRDFHPTDVMEDADGSLLVIDTGAWYKLCCPTAQLTKPDVLGAIYRIRRKGSTPPEDPLGKGIDWESGDPKDLVPHLADARPAVRKKAIAQLAAESAVGALADAVSTADSVDVRRNAVWALTRIDTTGARHAVRAALHDRSGSVRQAALHSIALHRDAAAVADVVKLLGDPSDAIKRVAAEALGRSGDPVAVGPLLGASALTEDEVLTHSLIYALIEIADPRSTRRGLAARSDRTQRAAMIALDQMRPRALDPRTVLPRLDSPNPLISEAANWISGRHPEWGGHLAGYLGRRLRASGAEAADELTAQLTRFSGNSDVQALLARTARGNYSAAACTVALGAMAAAPVREPPAGWAGAIAAALGRADTVEAALGAARGLPRPTEGEPELDTALLDVARNQSVGEGVRVRALDAGMGEAGALESGLYELAVGQVLPSVAIDARSAAARVLARALSIKDS